MKNNKIENDYNLSSLKDGTIGVCVAFTLIEIMIGILITSMVIIGGFQALSAVTIGKAKLIQQTDIQKESFYFTEKLFEMIKKGGIIDYEEYFNRKVIGNTTYLSGHFDIKSGFGNFGKDGIVEDGFVLFGGYGKGLYNCISLDGDKMTGSGCIQRYNSGSINYDGKHQRYGEYYYQFIDYNGNSNGDSGDEDSDGNIIGDDDDEYIGIGPSVFDFGANLTELYLISGDKKKRTLFRWNVKLDPEAGSSTCIIDSSSNTITGSGCLGTIEYLKLDGKDWGNDHDPNINDNLQYDGIIDTWVVNKDFNGGVEVVFGSDNKNYWVPIFPDTINVKEFKVYGYPNKNIYYSWKNASNKINISPYIDLKIKLMPSWKSRKKMRGYGKEVDFSMTVNLSELYSQ